MTIVVFMSSFDSNNSDLEIKLPYSFSIRVTIGKIVISFKLTDSYDISSLKILRPDLRWCFNFW